MDLEYARLRLGRFLKRDVLDDYLNDCYPAQMSACPSEVPNLSEPPDCPSTRRGNGSRESPQTKMAICKSDLLQSRSSLNSPPHTSLPMWDTILLASPASHFLDFPEPSGDCNGPRRSARVEMLMVIP